MSANATTISTMDEFVLEYANVGLHNEAGLRAAYRFGMLCDALSERHTWTDLGLAIGRGYQTPQRYARLYAAWANRGGADALVATAKRLDCYDTTKLADENLTAGGARVTHWRIVPQCASCGSHNVERLRMDAEAAEEIFAAVEAARNDDGKAPAR